MSTHLYALAKRYPNVPAALAELANLHSILALPTPTVHIVSDVHGEYIKLRQVINNASGSLRPRFDRLFAGKLTADEVSQLLKLIYYPRETWMRMTAGKDRIVRRAMLLAFVPNAVAVIRELARQYTLKHVDKIIPDPFDEMLHELVFEKELSRGPEFAARIVEPFLRHDRDLDLVRMIGRIVRNLSVGELIVAGDLGDRGPRLDKVIDLLMQQPNVAVTWGNHDTVWMAACLGHPAAIATVLRVSLRYRRLSQLEEGYGIPMAPLERLAREVYGDDPCERFKVKGEGMRDDLSMARMQKAAAVLQFKLEGQLFQRRTDWAMADRAMLHRIDPKAGTVDLGGVAVPLTDARLPTVDWAHPYKLTDGEQACLDRMTRSFLESGTLWKHMTFIASRGRMSIRRDRCAIFHGCVPVDDKGEFLAMTVDAQALRGKPLFDAIEVVVQRAFRKREMADVDLLYYLWTGPLSPCFGKDKMATFETYFVADKELHKETKNPYFKLIHEAPFCARVLREFGADEQQGFIVNGHVPVKLEKGEAPIKKSGRAITIDGAFAAAYGDKGFSLVLDAHRIYLAQHHHFESVDAAVEEGADIVPTVSDVQVHERPRTVGDTEKGLAIRDEIAALEDLVSAYERNLIREST